jgi:hypothetical protein
MNSQKKKIVTKVSQKYWPYILSDSVYGIINQIALYID